MCSISVTLAETFIYIPANYRKCWSKAPTVNTRENAHVTIITGGCYTSIHPALIQLGTAQLTLSYNPENALIKDYVTVKSERKTMLVPYGSPPPD